MTPSAVSHQPSATAGDGTTASASHRALSVVHAVLSLAPGGAERTVVELVKRCEGAIRNVVCCLDEAGEWAAQLLERGVPVVVLDRRPGFHPSHGLQIARVADTYAADVVHCHQYSPFVYGQIAHLCRPRLRVVFTEQGRLADAKPSRKRRLANRLLKHLPAKIVAVSEDLKRYMIAEGLPAERITVIPNAVDAGRCPDERTRQQAREALQVPTHAFVVGTAARFDRVKNLETLVEGFADISARLPAAILALIGDGPERQSLERLVDARGLTTRTRVTGMRSDVRSLLPGLDVFVNCSTSEGTSLTIMEAMAAALPVVATRVGGNPEVVDEWVTGLLVPPRSPFSLARAVLAVAGNRDWAMEMGLVGRWRMEADFSMDRMVDRYLRIYRGEEAC